MTHSVTQKKREFDWHPADIVAALRKAGWSLRKLDKAHGYQPNVMQHALRKPYPKAERIIAQAIGVKPQQIWPSRYDARGRSLVQKSSRQPRVSSTAQVVA